MIAGIYGSNSSYIADLTNIQNSITQVTQQISSGVRVSQASDDPAAVPEILDVSGVHRRTPPRPRRI